MTLRQALDMAIARLQSRNDIAEWASRDARLLLQSTLHVSYTYLLAHPEHRLTEQELASYQALIERRLLATPIQYLVGEQEFYGRPFQVQPGVLIPRPETELIIDAVKERFSSQEAIRLLDVGTGSGALAVTLALEFPQAQITAVDLSPVALQVAQKNAEQHGTLQRMTFLQSDLLQAISKKERFACIVSNPPYIPLEDRDALHPQVRQFEPEMALFGGNDGFDLYRHLIPQAWEVLPSSGWLILEIGERGAVLDRLLEGWKQVQYLEDLQRRPRTICAQRP